MKRIFYVIFIIIILNTFMTVSMASYSSDSDSDVICYLETSNNKIKKDDIIKVVLKMESTENILVNSISGNIEYNKKQLELCKKENNDLEIVSKGLGQKLGYKDTSSNLLENNDRGIVPFAMAVEAEKAIVANGEVLEIKFKVVSEIKETLDISLKQDVDNFSITTIKEQNGKKITSEDIEYKIENNLKNITINEEDNSIAEDNLPNAGKSTIFSYIIISGFVLMIISFGKLKKISINKILSILLIFTMIIGNSKTVKANNLGTNELLLSILNNVDRNKLNYLANIKISDSEFEEIKQFTIDLTMQQNSDYDKMKTILEWLNSNIKIGNSTNEPYDVFKNKVAVCQGYSNLFSVMMKTINIPTFVIQGDTSFGAHAWNYTYINNKWILADATNGIIKEDVKQYDKKYTNSYFEPYYIHMPLIEENNIVYSFNKGMAVINANTKENTLNILDQIEGYEITTLCTEAITENIEVLYIGRNVKYIQNNTNYGKKLKRIEVDVNNKFLASYSNVVYDKEFTKIIYIPRQIQQINLKGILNLNKETLINLDELSILKIEEGTETISTDAIILKNIKELYLPKTIKTIEKNALQLSDNCQIYVYKDSKAHQYVKENNLKYIIIDENTNIFPKGDLNKDNILDNKDAENILQKYNKGIIEQKDIEAGDINNDNLLNATDAAIILDIK